MHPKLRGGSKGRKTKVFRCIEERLLTPPSFLSMENRTCSHFLPKNNLRFSPKLSRISLYRPKSSYYTENLPNSTKSSVGGMKRRTKTLALIFGISQLSFLYVRKSKRYHKQQQNISLLVRQKLSCDITRNRYSTATPKDFNNNSET